MRALVFLGLLLVIGLIFLLAWLLRRVQQLNPRGNQAIKLISSHALGPRERLVLVQVGSEQVLLGLSAGRIAPLHVLKEPVHLPAVPATVVDVTGAGDAMLAAWIAAWLGGADPAGAARDGHRAAAATIESPHTVRPDLADVLARNAPEES